MILFSPPAQARTVKNGPPFWPRSPERCKTARLFRRAARNGVKQPAFFTAQPGTVQNSPPFSPRSPEWCKTARLFGRAARNGAKQPAFFTAQPGTVPNSPPFSSRRVATMQTAVPLGRSSRRFTPQLALYEAFPGALRLYRFIATSTPSRQKLRTISTARSTMAGIWASSSSVKRLST